MHHAQTDSCVIASKPYGGSAIGRTRPSFCSSQLVSSRSVVQEPAPKNIHLQGEVILNSAQCSRQCATMVSSRCTRRNTQQRRTEEGVFRRRVLRYRADKIRMLKRTMRPDLSALVGLSAERSDRAVEKRVVERRDHEAEARLRMSVLLDEEVAAEDTGDLTGHVKSGSLKDISAYLDLRSDSLVAADSVAKLAAKGGLLSIFEYLRTRYRNQKRYAHLSLAWDRALITSCENYSSSCEDVCRILCNKLKASPVSLDMAALFACIRSGRADILQFLVEVIPESTKINLAFGDNSLLLAAIRTGNILTTKLILQDKGVMSELVAYPHACLAEANSASAPMAVLVSEASEDDDLRTGRLFPDPRENPAFRQTPRAPRSQKASLLAIPDPAFRQTPRVPRSQKVSLPAVSDPASLPADADAVFARIEKAIRRGRLFDRQIMGAELP